MAVVTDRCSRINSLPLILVYSSASFGQVSVPAGRRTQSVERLSTIVPSGMRLSPVPVRRVTQTFPRAYAIITDAVFRRD